MTVKQRKTSPKKKAPAASETSDSIQQQIETFLKSGGEIEAIQSGISGQESMAAGKRTKTS